MEAFISEVISSVIQIILFSLIPFLWWLKTARKKVGFSNWLGLKWERNKKQNKIVVWIICTFIGFWIVGEFSLYVLKDIPTATSAFSESGFAAMPAVAWTMGYINEKKADGSIYPSWIIHGATNMLSGIIAAL